MIPRHALPKFLAGTALLTATGCVHYAPAPVDPQAVAVRQQAERADPAQVSARLAALAPGARWTPEHWDRLSLFAAALVYSPDIAAARAAIVSARARAAVARQAPGPTLSLATEYARDSSASSPWLLGAALDVPIDRGGVRGARISTADLAVADARYAYAETVWRVRMAIRRALIDWIGAREQARLYHALAEASARQMAAMTRRLAAGAVSRADLERVRGESADAARRAVDADNAALAARTALAGAVGLPERELGAEAPDWAAFDRPEALPGMALSADARRQALLGRPDLLRAMVAYGTAEQALRAEVARQYPQISVGPGYTWERGLVKLPLSVGLALPPLDRNRHAIAAAQAQRAERGRDMEAAVAAARSAIDQAAREGEAARAALAHVRAVEEPIARRLAAQADRELAAGAIDRVDWSAAQAGQWRALISEQDAVVRVRRADAALEEALVRPLDGPERAMLQGPETGAGE